MAAGTVNEVIKGQNGVIQVKKTITRDDGSQLIEISKPEDNDKILLDKQSELVQLQKQKQSLDDSVLAMAALIATKEDEITKIVASMA